jgi:hypothetical protein
MNIQHYKYPRTAHLPWSPGADEDDIIIDTVESFVGKEVVVTEKMDGECTSMYKDHIHARSMDSGYHQSRTWVQALHASIRYKLHDNQRICGENMFWVHSIVYTKLKSYFLMFNMWEDDTCLPWDVTKAYAEKFELTLVPELYRGVFDEDVIKALWSKDDADTVEGYVVRVVDSFHRDDFQQNVAKFVRKNHIQTDEHWMRSGGELNMLRL